MTMAQRCGMLLICVLCGRQTSVAADPGVLVDPAWLATHARGDSSVRLIELGPSREAFAAGHLPHAVFVDWRRQISDPTAPERYNKLSKSACEALLGSLGVSRDTTIVLSDTIQNRLSVRMFWMLRHYGHADIRVLNGGRKAWLRSGRSLVPNEPDIEPTSYTFDRAAAPLTADRSFIEERLDDRRTILIDGRPKPQFTGEAPGKIFHTGTEHARRGHIPSAINIPWAENLKPDGTFRSPAELHELYAPSGATSDTTVVAYCNEGLHAAMPWFVLTEILGHRDVRVYDDSMAEWANTDDTPMEVGSGR